MSRHLVRRRADAWVSDARRTRAANWQKHVLCAAFLERAASVILESRTLDGPRFDAVLALAKEVGLTREQLSCELRFLELRGVIASAPWERLNAPEGGSRSRAATAPALPTPAPPNALARFREVASQRVTRYGALTPNARQTLEADGAALGLNTDQIAAVLTAVAAHQIPAAVPVGAPAAADARLPAQPSPAESFRRWVKQKLAGYPSVVLAGEDEQGLIGVGAHRYHLAEVLAMSIVRDMATDRDMRLERDLDGASCHSTVGGSQQSLSEDPQHPEFDANDPRQLERRESYRSYLRRALAELPNGIVTFKTHRRLVEAGELFHGVAPQWIKPTINEVAGEMGSRFISQEQAIDHLSSLIDELIALDTFADGASRSRIYAEGTSWGLDPVDIEAILRRHIERIRLEEARERQQSRRLLVLFSAIVGLVFAVWLGLFLVRPPVDAEPARPTTLESPDDPASTVTDGAAVSWWDSELQAVAARVVRARPDLAVAIEQARTSDEAGRAAAYSQVIAACLPPASESSDRADIQALLARWYAADSSDTAARQIPERLLAPADSLDAAPPQEVHALRAAFGGCRIAARMWKDPALSAQRSAELGVRLATAVRELLDRGLAPRNWKTNASLHSRAVTMRHSRALAAEHPTQTGRLYRALAIETAGCVDQTTLDRLDVDYLAAVLPAVGPQWEEYRDVLRRVAHSQDALVVLKLLGLFQQASDANLRRELAGLFGQRLGTAPEGMSEAELTAGVRASVDGPAEESGVQRWERVASWADAALGRADDERTTPDILLQQALDCTYLATMACAAAQGDDALATFQELESRGPAPGDSRRPLARGTGGAVCRAVSRVG